MGRGAKADKINTKEYHCKICLDKILEFKSQLKLKTDTENIFCDHRKLSDYNLQQFRNFLSKQISSNNF